MTTLDLVVPEHPDGAAHGAHVARRDCVVQLGGGVGELRWHAFRLVDLHVWSQPPFEAARHLGLGPELAVTHAEGRVQHQPTVGRDVELVATVVGRAGRDQQVVVVAQEELVHHQVPQPQQRALVRARFEGRRDRPLRDLRRVLVELGEDLAVGLHRRDTGQLADGIQEPLPQDLQDDPGDVGDRVVRDEADDVRGQAEELPEVLRIGQRRTAVGCGHVDDRAEVHAVQRLGGECPGDEPAAGVGQDVDVVETERAEQLRQLCRVLLR